MQKCLSFDIESNSHNADFYVILKSKASNDWKGKQTWVFDEKGNLSMFSLEKSFVFLDYKPNINIHSILIQKKNQ